MTKYTFRPSDAKKLYQVRTGENLSNPQLGFHLHPEEEYKSHKKGFDRDKYYHSVRVSMLQMMKGLTKKIHISWVHRLCEKLGIDPNFLFGYPSEHDKDFNELVNKTEKKYE